ncbi:FAD-dependent monooxygenase [bacterium endosymbiont of Pedicinus badii]|uniref:FAD-dependent monooxygenase n=1 Tax=bacterium endosymbiont of Pedicinus badii TaxID=1719126 RepID=UPI0009BA565A|nr:FAD-dependent monooxygenase [bacterium endosymbiont of Pedicinus badii]OQM34011.1 hypothetical protein AOQ89_01465 [bacterium endosymbiont of Pedicinus badii]
MKKFDIAIYGVGIVGLCLAKSLIDLGYKVCLLDKIKNKIFYEKKEQFFVSLNESSKNFLEYLEIFKNFPNKLINYYKKILIFKKFKFEKIKFEKKNDFFTKIGYILEKNSLKKNLLESIKKKIVIFWNSSITEVKRKNFLYISLAKKEKIRTKFLICTEKEKFFTNRNNILPFFTNRYFIVCANIQITKNHKKSALQVFRNNKILAFLPKKNEKRGFIILSERYQKNKKYKKITKRKLENLVNNFFDSKLGVCKIQKKIQFNEINTFIIKKFFKKRVFFIGNCAHCLHPLAGQNLNAGIHEAKILFQFFKKIKKKQYLHTNENKIENFLKKKSYLLFFSIEFLYFFFLSNNFFHKRIRNLSISILNYFPKFKEILIDLISK